MMALKSMEDSYKDKDAKDAKDAKDGRGCERTFKAVSRASEDVWRVSKGFVRQRRHRFINSYNIEQDQ